MTIEIHSPGKQVDESFIKLLRTRLLALYHLQPKISRAEVFLRKLDRGNDRSAKCEIRLSMFKDNIQVSRNAPSFEKAANAVLKQLDKIIAEQVQSKDKLPDEIVTTVKP